MSDFLWTVVSAPFWFNIVLAFLALVAWLAYGIRSLTAPSAWVALALFYVWVAASNSWQLVPYPDPETTPDMVEGWRLWSHYILETLILSYLAAAAISLWALVWVSYGVYTKTVRITMLTVFYGGVTAIAQTGEVMQRYVCSTNSPDLGREYRYWANGESAEACGRLFGSLGLPEDIGPLFFPALTVLILPVVMWWTKHKLQKIR